MSKKKLGRILGSILLLLTALCGIYLFTGSYSGNEDVEAVLAPTEDIAIIESDDGSLVFVPSDPKAGVIFYPGGKVESKAYAPLMTAFAREDILCVLLSMPFDLAVFDRNAADGIQEQYPQIQEWYLAGHSLGGAMAASYAADHAEDYEGLFLLAAYSTEDLTNSGLNVISLYGSEDGVLNPVKYNEYRSNLPENTQEEIIPGGCHAYFGCYGFQDGDGTPAITNEEQIRITVDRCLSVINERR